MPNLFDWLKSIQEKGEELWDDETAKSYKPFIINRGIAQNMDTVMMAQEMNKNPHLTPEMQYRYLQATIKKKKRFSKWAKKSQNDSETIEMIMQYYDVSITKAVEYLKVLKPEQVDEIKRLTFTGGRTK